LVERYALDQERCTRASDSHFGVTLRAL